jgi:prevent-host-death family protein
MAGRRVPGTPAGGLSSLTRKTKQDNLSNMPRSRKDNAALNVGEAKQNFSELVARVAFGGETILIMRRGRPVAKLVPLGDSDAQPHLADVQGWLDDDDPFFDLVDGIVESRQAHMPRVLEVAEGLPHRRGKGR